MERVAGTGESEAEMWMRVRWEEQRVVGARVFF
jgi:hypothetical protein